jgi:hypothetical protein
MANLEIRVRTNTNLRLAVLIKWSNAPNEIENGQAHLKAVLLTNLKQELLCLEPDPVFSERASPFQWLGPKRFHQPPISIAELPPIKGMVECPKRNRERSGALKSCSFDKLKTGIALFGTVSLDHFIKTAK